jgi:hypothetical protein
VGTGEEIRRADWVWGVELCLVLITSSDD